MSKTCECCSLRPCTNEKYCSFCTEAHLLLLRSMAQDLANKAKLPAPTTLGVLGAGITLRNLEGEEADARDVLIRQIQALELELEVATERINDLAKDFVDMQSYAQFVEKETKVLDLIAAKTESHDALGNIAVVKVLSELHQEIRDGQHRKAPLKENSGK